MLFSFTLDYGFQYDKYSFTFWGELVEMSMDMDPAIISKAIRNMGSIVYKRMAHLTIPYKGEGPQAFVGCEPVCMAPGDPDIGVLHCGQGVMKLTEIKSFIRKTLEKAYEEKRILVDCEFCCKNTYKNPKFFRA